MPKTVLWTKNNNSPVIIRAFWAIICRPVVKKSRFIVELFSPFRTVFALSISKKIVKPGKFAFASYYLWARNLHASPGRWDWDARRHRIQKNIFFRCKKVSFSITHLGLFHLNLQGRCGPPLILMVWSWNRHILFWYCCPPLNIYWNLVPCPWLECSVDVSQMCAGACKLSYAVIINMNINKSYDDDLSQPCNVC